MGRRVKDFIEISEYTSLDQLINTLTAIRDSLPEESDPELRMKGDDVFGRRMSISYFRQLTDEEAACEARYSGADLPGANADIDALASKLNSVGYEREGRIAKRRIGRAR